CPASIILVPYTTLFRSIWNSRILGERTFQVWQINSWESLEQIDRENQAKSLKIAEEADLDKIVEYSNSTGAMFSSKIKDILFHIVNHSTYHRAQVAVELRQSGIDPISTDYIHYKRNIP